MTNQAPGSSLLQARGSHNDQLHDHNQNHNRLHARHHQTNHHSHDNRHYHHQQQHPHIRSPEDDHQGLKKLQDRQVVVVQTVSVVHVINGAGAVVDIQTLPYDTPPAVAPPQPPRLTAGVTTVDSGNLGANVLPSFLPPVVVPTIGDGLAPSSWTASATPTGLIASSNGSSLSSSSGSLTSAPLSSSTLFPTLSGTGGYFSSNSTRGPSFFSNSTITPHSLFVNSSRTVTLLETKAKSTTSTKSRKSTTLWTSTSADVPITTHAAGPGAGNPGIVDAAPPTPIPTPSDEPKGLTPEAQGAVAGGVVGGVAGIALLVLFAMFLLRWKKRHGGAIRLTGDGENTARGRIGPASGPSGLGGSDEARGMGPAGMSERRPVPFAIPASLASLTGQRRLPSAGSEEGGPSSSRGGSGGGSGEKGFYRVSGKKLISVLESGGDGYSDPHDSMTSTSSYYRDSVFPDSLPPQRLQLGSPMRPESGVMIMRSGPGRTPVQEQPGFFSSFDHLPLPQPSPAPSVRADPVGRSLISQDRSRGSSARTRFTEEL